MNPLDRFIPTPRMIEVDHVDLALSPDRAWQIVRHGNLAGSPLVRALFALRALPARVTGSDREELVLRLDDLESTPERPGFQILADDSPHAVVVGAIGKVWKLDIPFRHVAPDEYASVKEPDWVKVAWALHVSPLGENDSRVTFEVRVDATSDVAWRRFQRYFRVIGPGSHFIRHSLLAALGREHGTPEVKEAERPLLGDDLLPDATAQVTHGITIAATPERIWPWLLQLGCRRAGYYSWDVLDNGGRRSAREIHPELQTIHVGDVLPATPKGRDGFEVLAIEDNRALVLGGLFDPEAKTQLPFRAARPEKFWQVTWSFSLERLDARHTRLHVRGRAAFPASGRLHARWMTSVHHFMQKKQLEELAARVEGQLQRDDWRDVAEGAGGAAIMLAAMLTPFLRSARSHWGLDEADAARGYPGDDIVPEPRWMWTHGIEIDAPADEVWPWIAQIGANHAGFYSYQWLENLAGCNVHNAETIHSDWENHLGGALLLHPKAPPLAIEGLVKGQWFVAHGKPDPKSRERWVEASWLFLVEPLATKRSRLISRYRVAMSDDVATQLQFGSATMEPVGFAMDRRMLLGVKDRVERQRHVA
jgi:hypothetical protein